MMLFGLSMCYDDSEEELYPSLAQCTTDNVTFSGTIMPTIEESCLSCHGNDAAAKGGNVYLRTYSEIYNQRSAVLSAIKTNMPKGTNGLSSCSISQFTAWVNAGSPNN